MTTSTFRTTTINIPEISQIYIHLITITTTSHKVIPNTLTNMEEVQEEEGEEEEETKDEEEEEDFNN
jgi:hypothetical protein